MYSACVHTQGDTETCARHLRVCAVGLEPGLHASYYSVETTIFVMAHGPLLAACAVVNKCAQIRWMDSLCKIGVAGRIGQGCYISVMRE